MEAKMSKATNSLCKQTQNLETLEMRMPLSTNFSVTKQKPQRSASMGPQHLNIKTEHPNVRRRKGGKAGKHVKHSRSENLIGKLEI